MADTTKEIKIKTNITKDTGTLTTYMDSKDRHAHINAFKGMAYRLIEDKQRTKIKSVLIIQYKVRA